MGYGSGSSQELNIIFQLCQQLSRLGFLFRFYAIDFGEVPGQLFCKMSLSLCLSVSLWLDLT